MSMQRFLNVLFSLTCLVVVKAQAVDGLYFRAEGGWANQTGFPSQRQLNASSVTQTNAPTSVRGSVGYNHDFEFNREIGIGFEVSTGQYGEITYHFPDAEDLRIFSATLEFLGTIVFHLRQFDLFSEVGGLRLTPITNGDNIIHTHTIVNPEAIIGAAYNFQGTQYPLLRHLAISLSYIKIFTNTHDDADLTDSINDSWKASTAVNAVLIGLRYTFGP